MINVNCIYVDTYRVCHHPKKHKPRLRNLYGVFMKPCMEPEKQCDLKVVHQRPEGLPSLPPQGGTGVKEPKPKKVEIIHTFQVVCPKCGAKDENTNRTKK